MVKETENLVHTLCPFLVGSTVISYGLWQKPVGGLYQPANAKRHPMSPSGTDQKWAKHVDRTLLSRSDFSVSLTISLKKKKKNPPAVQETLV